MISILKKFPKPIERYLYYRKPIDKHINKNNWSEYYDYTRKPQKGTFYNLIFLNSANTYIAATIEWNNRR